MRSVIAIIIFTIVFIIAAYSYDSYNQSGPIGAPFALTDSNGHTVTQDDIRSKPAAVFFGYTMCPDICPTTLFDMQTWLEELGPEADKIGVWFFTVDPEHDTPEVLHEYLGNFSNKITGIGGDPEKVRAAVNSFNIVAEKVPGDYGDYTYDHTAAVILLRKGGTVAGFLPYQPNIGSESENRNIALAKIRNLIDSPKGTSDWSFAAIIDKLRNLVSAQPS